MLTHLADFDLKMIRIFVAIAEARGITAAESKLQMNQSAISNQLATLETRLGFRLCERGRGGFQLTFKGEQFLAVALRLLQSVDDFCLETKNLDKKLIGTLNICLIGHTYYQHNIKISQAINTFLKRDQAVKFNMSIIPASEVEDKIASGEIDIAIGYFWNRVASFSYTPLFVEKQSAYCGVDHPLFNQSQISEEAVIQGNFNWVRRTYPVPESNYNNYDPLRDAVANNMEAAALLIMSGNYLGYLPSHFAQIYLDHNLLKNILPQRLSYEVTFHLVHQRKIKSELVKAFLSDIKTVYLQS